MGQIKFRQCYTELVEHYLRMAVRHKSVSSETPKDWHSFTEYWIDRLSDEDKKFIQFVFDYQFYNTTEGLYCFQSDENMYAKRKRLAMLEKQFAIDGGLYEEVVE